MEEKRRQRLDVELVKRGLIFTRKKAQVCIKKGFVLINGKVSKKSSIMVSEEDKLEVTGKEKYVSRGGEKLEAALKYFKISPEGCTALDVGASTGGFTDCLLQYGAQKVTAIDAGRGQLAEKLKKDERVKYREGVNARYLKKSDFKKKFDFIVIDVSFISLLKVFPTILPLAGKACTLIVLVKPQFEVGKEGLGKGGIVKDEKLRQEALEKIKHYIVGLKDWNVIGYIRSPFKEGNEEFLLCAQK